jgi:hypothetical protein
MKDLIGKWTGKSQLWMYPGDSVHESSTTAEVGRLAQGQFITIAYDWAFDGEPQDGLIIYGLYPEEPPGTSLWLDSWHVANSYMSFETEVGDDVQIIMRGSYPAPEGPDWGWRIEIEPKAPDAFELCLFNIAPDGQEALAVLADYERA